ncbi:MAG: glycosyltransferase family 4 protein [Firmicutes bacterium]|nr:glycosyltransferase family 4 protein [Bacillota bacterium]
MKKVLMIAYSFPPAGGPGVQRTSKFVKYLSRYGWEPVILTRDTLNMPLKDESLIKDIPDGVNIIRTKAWDLTCGKGITGLIGKFISRKLLIPDSERLWEIFSRKVAEKAIENQNIRLIYTTSLPYSSHLMGIYLKKKYPQISWVADFRDEWTNNPYILDNPYNPVRMSIERKMEKNVLKTADCLITNTPVMLKNFIEKNSYIDNLKEKFFVIPNGYDTDDFKHINIKFFSSETKHEKKGATLKNNKFTITYTGSFYGRRKPDIFFSALAQLIGENRINKDKIYVKLIGNFKADQIKQLLEKHNLEGLVDILPYMDHDECIRNMAASDCLLLIEGSGPGAEAFYTGKVFEYMVTGRPILAIIPENGAAAQLIRETSTGLISDCSDLEAAKRNIEKLYTAWLKGINVYFPNKGEIKKYERNTLTMELAKVFDKALEKPSCQ